VVDDPQDQVVLPEAETKRDAEREQTDEQTRAQLVEVLDERQPLVVTYRPNATGQGPPPGAGLGAAPGRLALL
jgi:hypothetical protein